ncbi:MAG: hypothetical protein H7A23_01135 [Leptospiraceae bacterium]|nr:hypothetical protein [Leptospiraceae bacterium]MCP5493135.1 hypothetical protein [Leptospiraceae bacterium]
MEIRGMNTAVYSVPNLLAREQKPSRFSYMDFIKKLTSFNNPNANIINSHIDENDKDNLNYLRPAKESQKSSSTEKHKTKDPNEIKSFFESRYSSIQNKLNLLQSSLAKEQAKLQILQDKNIDQHELKNFLFGGNPLFQDSVFIEFDRTILIHKISTIKNTIEKQIQFLEKESENLLSITKPREISHAVQKIARSNHTNFNFKPIPDAKLEDLLKD